MWASGLLTVTQADINNRLRFGVDDLRRGDTFLLRQGGVGAGRGARSAGPVEVNDIAPYNGLVVVSLGPSARRGVVAEESIDRASATMMMKGTTYATRHARWGVSP